MTVFENVAFGLRVRPRAARPSEPRSATACSELLQLVQLGRPGATAIRRSFPAASGSAWRWPGRWPSSRKVLLLDEPFGALDAKVRQELRRWLRRLHDEIHVTSVFVTHDQEEALEVADRVVVMNQGRIEQIGTPDEVFDQPANPFVDGLPGQRERVPRPHPPGTGEHRRRRAEVPEYAEAHDPPAVAFVRTSTSSRTRPPGGVEAVVRIPGHRTGGPAGIGAGTRSPYD